MEHARHLTLSPIRKPLTSRQNETAQVGTSVSFSVDFGFLRAQQQLYRTDTVEIESFSASIFHDGGYHGYAEVQQAAGSFRGEQRAELRHLADVYDRQFSPPFVTVANSPWLSSGY